MPLHGPGGLVDSRTAARRGRAIPPAAADRVAARWSLASSSGSEPFDSGAAIAFSLRVRRVPGEVRRRRRDPASAAITDICRDAGAFAGACATSPRAAAAPPRGGRWCFGDVQRRRSHRRCTACRAAAAILLECAPRDARKRETIANASSRCAAPRRRERQKTGQRPAAARSAYAKPPRHASCATFRGTSRRVDRVRARRRRVTESLRLSLRRSRRAAGWRRSVAASSAAGLSSLAIPRGRRRANAARRGVNARPPPPRLAEDDTYRRPRRGANSQDAARCRREHRALLRADDGLAPAATAPYHARPPLDATADRLAERGAAARAAYAASGGERRQFSRRASRAASPRGNGTTSCHGARGPRRRARAPFCAPASCGTKEARKRRARGRPATRRAPPLQPLRAVARRRAAKRRIAIARRDRARGGDALEREREVP